MWEETRFDAGLRFNHFGETLEQGYGDVKPRNIIRELEFEPTIIVSWPAQGKQLLTVNTPFP